ncbi:MAG: hypothetical protein ABSC18_07480 [Verrucomicrobiota bacterium]|jgi:hypothetical protein
MPKITRPFTVWQARHLLNLRRGFTLRVLRAGKPRSSFLGEARILPVNPLLRD